MGNRGSKSVVRYYSAVVKEQRVNVYRYLQYPQLSFWDGPLQGSRPKGQCPFWGLGESTPPGWMFVIYLRCILMSLEISAKVKKFCIKITRIQR